MEPLVTIAIVSPEKGEGAGRALGEARGQSWAKKEILVEGRGEGSIPGERGAAKGIVRRVPVPEGLSAHAALAREARGEWIQWLQPGEKLSPAKVEAQLREAGDLSRWQLLCSPYFLRLEESAPALDPRSNALSYVARLGPEFPFVAPLLWSTAFLRAFFREPGRLLPGGGERALLGRLRRDGRIWLGSEAAGDCPGTGRDPTREEWRRTVAWAFVLASAEERERLFRLLQELDPSLAGERAALRPGALLRRLRETERRFRQARRRLLQKWGLRRKALPEAAGKAEKDAYAGWIAAYQALDEADRQAIRREIGRFPRRPLLSVVMPVFNTPEKWLQRAIDSIREQLYPDWELCIADDGSTAARIRPLLEENRERDPRIRVVFRERSGGIAAASNSALALASGEWVALLDHDDELPEEAFYVVVREILRDPEVRLLYSDEDKIDESGRRFDPCFKPEFSPDLLLSQNCLNHLGVYQAELFRSLGGFRSGLDGSQDYDLALRFVEKLEPRRIRRIPRVLYHWRAIAGSGAAREEAKPYAYEAARRAIGDHLGRIGEAAEVLRTPIAWGYRVRRKAQADLGVSLLLGAGGNEERLRRSVESIRSRTERHGYELLVVGPAGEGWPEGVRSLTAPGELTMPALWNWAARQARGEVLVFLEAPAEPSGGGWLAELASHAVRPEVGAVGARILAPDGRVAEAGVVLGLERSAEPAFRGWGGESIGYFGQAVLIRNPSAVGAACLATRRALFEECGGLDPGYRRGLWDVDYCLRLREKGYRIVFTPYAELVRAEELPEATAEDRELFRERWASWIDRDPAYNPNLSLERAYGLAWPPRSPRPWRGGAERGPEEPAR